MNIKTLFSNPLGRHLSSLGIAVVAAVAAPATTNAQTILYSTVEDFAQFNGGTGVTSTDFFSVDNTVNGAGNTIDPGGVGTTGSLQLTLTANWGQVSGGLFSGPTDATLNAIAPGSSGTNIAAAQGTATFDLYPGDLTSWYNIYLWVNYPNHNWWDGAQQLWPDPSKGGSVTSFTGADGGTWWHISIPYTIDAATGSFSMGFMSNSDSPNVGATFYVDNVQFNATAVPEPATTVMLLIGSLSVTLLFRRRNSAQFPAQ